MTNNHDSDDCNDSRQNCSSNLQNFHNSKQRMVTSIHILRDNAIYAKSSKEYKKLYQNPSMDRNSNSASNNQNDMIPYKNGLSYWNSNRRPLHKNHNHYPHNSHHRNHHNCNRYNNAVLSYHHSPHHNRYHRNIEQINWQP